MSVIADAALDWRREPLNTGFGFKGGALTELWQVKCTLKTDTGLSARGESVQSVLWSDAAVYSIFGQEEGNCLMLFLTRYALSLLRGMELTDPTEMLRAILPSVLEYGRSITGLSALRETFALNALTGLDWAIWRLYRMERGFPDFDALTRPFTGYLQGRQRALGSIPLISYDTSDEVIRELAGTGRFIFKIKTGSNPGGRGDLSEMLRWDIERLSHIHSILGGIDTPWTDSGHPAYYLDANGRYDTTERVMELLDAAGSMGALDRIVLLEEPFGEDNLQDVRSLPVRVAGDESAHSAADAVRLMDDFGYSAMALKPIAKTLSVSLEVLEAAGRRGVPCFCADLTVNPAMVEENRRFAAGLSPIPGLRAGAFETNGGQNYRNWDRLCRESPSFGRDWTELRGGFYPLSDEYYKLDGMIWSD